MNEDQPLEVLTAHLAQVRSNQPRVTLREAQAQAASVKVHLDISGNGTRLFGNFPIGKAQKLSEFQIKCIADARIESVEPVK